MSAPAPMRMAMIGGAAPSMIGPVHRIAATMDRRFELLAAIPSRDVARGREAGAGWGIPEGRVYADMAALLAAERGRLDAVAICTPNDSHYAYTKAALEAGLHVMLDKPLCNDPREGAELAQLAHDKGLVLALTHAYAGYPMVREARSRVAAGEIGDIRIVLVEYLGSGLAKRVEDGPDAARRWRLRPEISGPSLVLGDIGTHAHHLACFVSGRRMTQVSAEVRTLMPGRAVHDYAQMRFRLDGGATGTLIATQAAAGAQNDISVRVFGTIGSVAWRHSARDYLTIAGLDGESRTIEAGSPLLCASALRASRIKRTGHTEGLHEAFANLYADFADLIVARRNGDLSDAAAADLPLARDGVEGLNFVAAALESSAAAGKTVDIAIA
ncbi:MAG: gfo/Idh/MocA family oxidoreductase [Alphaproteobacteria bacterium]|nr:gfo/Idh/MocA family oxidoreductase [Alphaproteobacteria bacterium]